MAGDHEDSKGSGACRGRQEASGGGHWITDPGLTAVRVVCGLRACRAIRTGWLRTLPSVHLRPIDVMVYHGPRGDLVSRGVSRLDAFSGYPVRT